MKWNPASLVLGTLAVAPIVSHATVYFTVEQVKTAMFAGATLTPVTVPLTADEQQQLKTQTRVNRSFKPEAIFRSNTGGFLIIDKVIGKHELITYAVAFDAKGNIKQVEILEYKETYGMQVRNHSWRKQFIGKNSTSTIELTRDISNISGATLSSKNLTDGIRRMTRFYQLKLANLA